MNSTNDWWRAEIEWETPAGKLLKRFVTSLPKSRTYHLTVFGSAPLQLTIDRTLLSGDVDIFSDDDDDIAPLIVEQGLNKEHGGLYLEAGFELSFRTSPRWRTRAKSVQIENVTLTFPHALDILIGKLDRLAPKDLEAFQRVMSHTGHPTEDELKRELQNAVDLFRPGFNEEGPNRYTENTERLWRELFNKTIDVRTEIIAPALQRRKQGYGETPPDYKRALGE
jgi:hypothetical protein